MKLMNVCAYLLIAGMVMISAGRADADTSIVKTAGIYSLSGTWKNIAFSEKKSVFEARFTVTSASMDVNTDIALSDRAESSWEFAASVRIKNGKILANGVGDLSFTPNVTHAFRMVIDVEKDLYSAYVKVGTASEKLIGANIPFKRKVSHINTVVLFGSAVTYNLSDITLIDESGTQTLVVKTAGTYNLSGAWRNFTVNEQTGPFEAKFTYISSTDDANTDLAFSDKPESSWNFAASIRVKNRKIVANGVGNIPFTANVQHTFRMVVNPERDTYSAYVKVGTNSEQLIAADVPFKRAVSKLNTFVLYAGPSFTISDLTITGGASSQPQPTLTPVPNSAPQLTENCPTHLTEGETYSCRATGSDKDGDSLTYDLAGGNTCGFVTVIASSGNITLKPLSSHVGVCTLAVRVSDGKLTTTTTKTLTIASKAILVTAQGSYSLNGSWKNVGMPEQTGAFQATFTFKSDRSDVNADIAFSDKAETSWNFAASVRVKNQKILANGVGNIAFTPNVNYTFRLLVDVKTDTYSAYVKAGSGSEQLIGANIPFKRAVSTLNTLVLFGSAVRFDLSNISISQPGDVIAQPQPPPAPQPQPEPEDSPSSGSGKNYVLPTPKNVTATFYVATNGNDSNSGTSSSPWRTIAKANNTLKAGQMVIVRGGTYNEQINPANSGTASARIYYQAASGEKVYINGVNAGEPAAYIRRNYITLDGFYIRQTRPVKDKSKRNHIRVEGHYNHLLNLKVINSRGALEDYHNGIRETAISLVGDYNLVQKSHLQGFWFGMQIAEGSHFNTIRDNVIHDNTMDAIRLTTSYNAIQGNLIEGNRLSGSYFSDGIQSNGNFDLSAEELKKDTSACGVIIRDNVIFDNAENNIDIKGSCHMVIENNILYGSTGDNDGTYMTDPPSPDRGTGCAIHKGTNQGSKQIIIRRNIIYDNKCGVNMYDSWMIYNNTIVNNNRDFTGPNSKFVESGKPLFYGIAGQAGVAINNIIGDHQSVEAMSDPSSNLFDRNMYYNTFKALEFISGGSNYPRISFSQWQAKGKDQNGEASDPRFVNVPSRPTKSMTNLDFRLRSTSPAIDSGMSLTRTASSGSGQNIPVKDARFFYDGYGVVDGDLIRVGANSPVRIFKVDYSKHILTVDRGISWQSGDAVNLDYRGSAPDLGALEY